jgi:hypothetical protein
MTHRGSNGADELYQGSDIGQTIIKIPTEPWQEDRRTVERAIQAQRCRLPAAGSRPRGNSRPVGTIATALLAES